jgi:shikimate dehydrogenase
LRNGYRFSLIGEEISYSQSPAIFAEIFRQAGVKGEFELKSVQPHQLQSTLKQQILDGVRGTCVTIPYKQAIVEYLDNVDAIAQQIGAVNCVAVVEQQLLGFNTDAFGFASPLRRFRREELGEKALILGTGGSARAVAHSLYTDFGYRNITLVSRSTERLESAIRRLQTTYHKVTAAGIVSPNESDSFAEKYDLVVNATPLGGFRPPDQSPFGADIPCTSNGIYYDLNYNRPNKLVEAARGQGLVVLDGAAMLVAQAVKSFQIWTDIEVPAEPIYVAVFGQQ